MDDVVVLVDRTDRDLGVAEKMRVHREATLHRAFSVFLFDGAGRFLLQRRARHKYHSGGLWTNTCCSHPGPDETVEDAAANRLQEEMGIRCDLTKAFDFVYRSRVGERLFEHEFDHVYVGRYDGGVRPHRDEVMDWRWMEEERVRADLRANGAGYTPWFAIAAARAARHHRVLLPDPPPKRTERNEE